MPSMNVNVDPALPGMSLITNPATMPAPRGSAVSSPANKASHGAAANVVDDDQDPKRHEAYKLIQCVVWADGYRATFEFDLVSKVSFGQLQEE